MVPGLFKLAFCNDPIPIISDNFDENNILETLRWYNKPNLRKTLVDCWDTNLLNGLFNASPHY
jgi:hypothetical protein